MNTFFNSIKKHIDASDVISFDIFDTLLLRPYVKPTDLFLHIEKIENIEGFRNLRVSAEQSAREKKSTEEIQLEDIYKELDDRYQYLLAKEQAFEEMVLRINPEMVDVFNYAVTQGKRVIVTSDMYLSKNLLARILEKNKFTGWEKLFVSSEIGLTKESGNLFKYILNDLNIDPRSVLHIGDNKHSDYKMPISLGIKAVLYQPVITEFINSSQRFGFFKNTDTLASSIIIGLLAQRWAKQKTGFIPSDCYWDFLGYQYAGPIIYAYAKFIENEAKQNDFEHILFVARDGYTIKKVFETFDSKVSNSYVYAPRFLSSICLCDKANLNAEKIIEEYSAISPEIKLKRLKQKLVSDDDYKNFIEQNEDLFSSIRQKNLNEYRNYLLDKVAGAKRIAIVDSLTIGLSAQKLIQSALEFQVRGLYWCDLSKDGNEEFSTSSFTRNSSNAVSDVEAITKNWNFMEFLMTSTELPVKRLAPNGSPIYHDSSSYEEIRSAFYSQVSQQAVYFAEDIKAIFGELDVYFDPKTIINWVNLFVEYPTEKDIDNMMQVHHAANAAHTEYAPLFCAEFSFTDFAKNPKKTLKNLKSLKWKTKKQQLILSLLNPIKCKFRGLKHINIALFPNFKRQYFGFSISIMDVIRWAFTVGKI